MQDGIEAIRQELKRLHLEGVERVFVEETTMQEVAQAQPAAPATESPQVTEVPEPKKKARAVKPSSGKTFPLPPVLELPDGDASKQMQWLRQAMLDCPTTQEQLGSTGKIVFGEGALQADLFFCGEAPSEEEARSGKPFVGKAGELLDKIISAMGLAREQVYLSNILHWRPDLDKPHGNRPPTAEEMAFSLFYIKAQIKIIRPKVIIALGNTAVSGLLGPNPDRRMGGIRGTWLEFEEIPVMATFHPSYLLRRNDNSTKRQVWEDLLLVMEKTGMPISEKQRGYFLPKN